MAVLSYKIFDWHPCSTTFKYQERVMVTFCSNGTLFWGCVKEAMAS